jgi:hypothetical protein
VLDGIGIEIQWRLKILYQSRNSLGLTQLIVEWENYLYTGSRFPERGFNHPLPSSGQNKEKLKIQIYSTCASSWRLLG